MNLRARVKDGDPHAFEVLFAENAKSVYNHAFRTTGDWSVAEDVVALTFLEAWRLRDRVDTEGGSLRPWLLGIAVNVVRNVGRTGRRHAAAMARMPRDQAMPDFADDLVGRIDDTETIARVRQALRKLRRSEREVFALCVWERLDSASAAEALGIPVGTVRSRLSRARAKLRRMLGPHTRYAPPSPGDAAPRPALAARSAGRRTPAAARPGKDL